MRCIGELPELPRDQEGRLLTDVDGVVADPLEAARDDDHPQAPLALRLVIGEVENTFDGAAVCPIDQLVEVARWPISSNAWTRPSSCSTSETSLVSLAIVTQ